MELHDEELKAHLMETDAEFRRLCEEHRDMKRRVEELEAKPHLTPEEEMEEHRLKKVKLAIKDQITEVMSRHRAHA